jgi:drug/metabolite transporter (DMT)-like permease
MFSYLLNSKTAIIIYYSKSLLIAAVAYLILREPYTGINIIASVGAFLGIALYTYDKPSTNENDVIASGFKDPESNFIQNLMATSLAFVKSSLNDFLFVTVSSLSVSIVLILTRIMNQHLHFVFSPFYYSCVLFIVCILGAILFPTEFSLEKYEFMD